LKPLDRLNLTSIVAASRMFGVEDPKPRAIGPCPACQAIRRSRSDKRPPVSLWHKGPRPMWRCYACDAKGGTADFVACCLFGEVPPARDHRWGELLRFCRSKGLVEEGR
jgi:hypothetical protein